MVVVESSRRWSVVRIGRGRFVVVVPFQWSSLGPHLKRVLVLRPQFENCDLCCAWLVVVAFLLHFVLCRHPTPT